jgi:hypothetical protein
MDGMEQKTITLVIILPSAEVDAQNRLHFVVLYGEDVLENAAFASGSFESEDQLLEKVADTIDAFKLDNPDSGMLVFVPEIESSQLVAAFEVTPIPVSFMSLEDCMSLQPQVINLFG